MAPDFLFCGRCGTRLSLSSAPPPAPAPAPAPAPRLLRNERRTVTVLFADISGYTSLSEQLDPEEVTTLLQDCFADLSEEVREREGWLAKYLGDAILAVFGAPQAHEDDPVRAVRAAMAMQVRMQEFTRRTAKRLAHPLQLHIGVNTGLVIAGPSEDPERSGHGSDFTVIGDAVNVASRLQSAAKAGQIVVGQATYEASRWAFEYQPLPPLELKGKREKVTAYACLKERDEPLSARGLEELHAPMLGRDAELDQLMQAFESCRGGQAQVAFLIGDAGIGKSRLVREFVRAAREAAPGLQCWQAAATTDRPVPFGVVQQLLASAGDPPDPVIGRLLELTDPARAAAGDEFFDLDPERRQQRLYMLAREALEARAAAGPLLLVLDDLHWADDSSISLLRFLAARPGQRPVFFLFIHRPDFDRLADWRTQAQVRSIDLPPLSDEAVQGLLQAYFGPAFAQFPPSLVDTLVQRAGGYPFYLEELLRTLIHQGVIRREAGWQVSLPTEPLVVPTSIQALLLTRMDRLQTDTRLLLQQVSVLGLSFPDRLAAAYATPDSALSRLDDLQEDEWLESTADAGEAARQFRHLLGRDVAYESLLVKTRAQLHKRAAEVIHDLYADSLKRHILSLAEHYYHAQDTAHGPAFLEQAGDQAAELYANVEAGTWYRRALERLPEASGADRARLNTKLGDTLQAQARFDQAVEAWQAGLEYWQAAGEAADPQVALHRRIAHALWSKGDVSAAQQHLQAGLALAGQQAETAAAAALYQELASQALHRGDSPAAIDWAQRALDLSQRLAAHEQASLAANTLGVALARSGDVERGQRSVEQSRAIALEHRLALAAGQATANLAVLYANTDPLRAAEMCNQGLAEARRIGHIAIQPWFYATLAGSLHACASDYGTAIRSAESAAELDRQLGLRSHLPVPLIVLAQIHECHGREAEAETHYQEALALAQELTDPQLIFPCLEGLGNLYLVRGDQARGEAYLHQARQVCEAAGFSMEEMVLLPFFV